MENNKIVVELLNATVLDFKTNDGSVIQGLKVYYYENDSNDNSIRGKIVDNFFSTDKLSNYKSVYEDLKNYQLFFL